MQIVKSFVNLAFVIWGFHSIEARAMNDCVVFPERTEAPVVRACEDESHYTFEIAGLESRYVKEDYRARLVQVLRDWFTAQAINMPADGAIEFWLAVPETNPASAQARAVMYWPGGAVVAYLPIAPESWQLSNKHVAVLGDQLKYPATYGHRPGAILVQQQEGAVHSEVAAFLASHGLDDPLPTGKDRHMYRVEVFKEASALTSILAHPQTKQLIKNISVNSVVEWVAQRQRVFAFSLPTQ